MLGTITWDTDLGVVTAPLLEERAAASALESKVVLGHAALEIGAAANVIIRAHTPRGPEIADEFSTDDPGSTSEHLADTTVTDPPEIGAGIGSSFARVSVRQDKKVTWDKGAKSGYLFDILTRDIDAYDIAPNQKQALFWPGAAHPVGTVHMPARAALTFDVDAREEIAPAAATLWAVAAAEILDTVTGGFAL